MWNLISDINNWPNWNPDVKSAALLGPLASGTEFRWKAGPGTITSRLIDVEAPRRISWSGRTLGIKAEHTWEFEPLETGTRVRTEETWDGLLPRLLRGLMRSTLQKSLDSGLQRLRAEAVLRSGR